MKIKLTISSFLLLFSLGVFAQNRNAVSTAGTGTLEYLNPLSAPALSFDNRYSGTHGSPYYHNDFKAATLIINEQDTIQGVEARVQLTVPYVEVKVNGQIRGQVSFKSLRYLKLRHLDGTKDEFVTKEIEEQEELLAVLHDGKVKLYQRLRKRLMKADYGGSHSVDKRYDEYVDLYAYYLEDEKGVLHKVKLRAKDFITVMPSHKSRIKDFFRANIIKTADDVLPLLTKVAS
ncbi:MAG: hypothetical protein AB8G22_19000 [Saprospiraceae bacterium]